MSAKTCLLALPIQSLMPASKKLDNPIKVKNSVALEISPSCGLIKCYSSVICSIHELKSEIKFGLAMKTIPTIKMKAPKDTKPK